MAKDSAFFVYIVVFTGFISCLGPVAAVAQGYEGLIAAPPSEEEASPATPSPAPAPAPEAGGYYGLLAPAPAPAAQQPVQQQEPAGYGGLIPGYAGGPAVQPAPAVAQPAPVKTSDDLKAAAAAQAEDQDGNAVPDELETPSKVSEGTAKRLARPRQRIQNMLPVEYMAKQNVDLLLSEVRNKNLTPAAHAESVQKAHTKLSTLATGLRFRKMVPDKTYLDMGLSDTFIQEEKEGNEKALARLDAALEELKGYQ